MDPKAKPLTEIKLPADIITSGDPEGKWQLTWASDQLLKEPVDTEFKKGKVQLKYCGELSASYKFEPYRLSFSEVSKVQNSCKDMKPEPTAVRESFTRAVRTVLRQKKLMVFDQEGKLILSFKR